MITAMYTPTKFKQTDIKLLYQHIQDNPLGAVISCSQSVLDAEYIPLQLVETDNGAKLQGHIARANSLWQRCEQQQSVLILFQGAQGYISPNYYPSKQEQGKAVPTWNYSVVQVRGKVCFIDDKSWLLSFLSEFSDRQERHQTRPWSVKDAPENYIDKMLRAVIGVEIEIEEIVGNFKLSQNKSEQDYQGVLAGLDSSNKTSEQLLAKKMRA